MVLRLGFVTPSPMFRTQSPGASRNPHASAYMSADEALRHAEWRFMERTGVAFASGSLPSALG